MTTLRLVPAVLIALGMQFSIGALPAGERTVFPPEARDWFEFGEKLEQQGQPRDAVAAYEEAIRLGMKEFPRVHLYRARALQELKENDAAVGRYTQFLDDFGLEDSCRH